MGWNIQTSDPGGGQEIILFFKASISVLGTRPVSCSVGAWVYFSVGKKAEA